MTEEPQKQETDKEAMERWAEAMRNPHKYQEPAQRHEPEERLDGWYMVLSFIVPLYGFYFFLSYRDAQPRRARLALRAALLNIVLLVLLPILLKIWNAD